MKRVIPWTKILLLLTIVGILSSTVYHAIDKYFTIKYELDETYKSVTGFNITGNTPVRKFCFTDIDVSVKYNHDTLIISSKIAITGFKPKGLEDDGLILIAVDKNGEEYRFRRITDGIMLFTFRDNLTVLNPKNECFEFPNK